MLQKCYGIVTEMLQNVTKVLQIVTNRLRKCYKTIKYHTPFLPCCTDTRG